MSARAHFVYRAYDIHGRLLYVGCTKRPKARLADHRVNHAPWLALVARTRQAGPFTYDGARAIERDALLNEYPLYGDTPQRKSARNLRESWINRRLASVVTPDFTVADLYAAHAALGQQADSGTDWMALAERSVRSKVA